MPISGNVGARYVTIDIETPGFVVFPSVTKPPLLKMQMEKMLLHQIQAM